MLPELIKIQGGLGGGVDAFVTKINSAGNAHIFSTYLGGSETDTGNAIAVDSLGNSYVVGNTASSDFPTENALQPIRVGDSGFVTKLNPSGSSKLFSTYLGAVGCCIGVGDIAVDPSQHAYVIGSASTPNLPTVNAIQPNKMGGSDAFVAKYSTSGSSYSYLTYLGGDESDNPHAIDVDSAGTAYVTGETESLNFPTVNPFQIGLPTINIESDTFIFKISTPESFSLSAVISNPTPIQVEQFGRSSAISGTNVVISAVEVDGEISLGQVFFYNCLAISSCTLVGTLDNPSPDDEDGFGEFLDISGTKVVTSSAREAVDIDGDGTPEPQVGEAYLYDCFNNDCSLVDIISNPSPKPSSSFGDHAVSIFGDYVAIGAPAADFNGDINVGEAFFFDCSSSSCELVDTLSNPSPEAGNIFGLSIDVYETNVVVGAGRVDSGGIDGVGEAYLFDCSGMSCNLLDTIENPTPEDSRNTKERFGEPISISGTNVAIGAIGVDVDYDDNGDISENEIDQGEVYYYDCSNPTNCVLVDTLQNPSPVLQIGIGNAERFARGAISLDGNVLLISDLGAQLDLDGSGLIEDDEVGIGEVYLYECSTNLGCTLVETLLNPTPERGEAFGASASLSLSSSTNVIVGAPAAEDDGEVYFFSNTPIDFDGDGILNDSDNCPFIANPNQSDIDEDGVGDVCDNAPNDFNPGQEDSDVDGIGNVVDNCPADFNPDQTDTDGDGPGDACDENPTLTCGFGTIQQGTQCVQDPLVTQQIIDLQNDLAAAEADRDAALDDLNNLYTNNSCFPLAGTIQAILDCITNLNSDLATTQADLNAANQRISELESILDSGEITICHNGDKTKTISLGALSSHLGHGDTIGTCP